MRNFRFILLVVLLVGILCSCKTPQSEVKQTIAPAAQEQVSEATAETQCTTDADCVKSACCHASACVPIAQKPPCERAICTMSCSGPMDCGKGHCACVDGMCAVEASVEKVPPAFKQEETE